MILETGQKLHVITRRGFEQDLRRHFVGRVLQCTDAAVKVEGYVFVHDANRNEFVRRPELRTRVFSLVDVGNVINVIPREVDLDALVYRIDEKRRLVVTDDAGFRLDIQEFGSLR